MPNQEAAQLVEAFDHHAPALREVAPQVYEGLREAGPVVWSNAHGGYWVAADHATVPSG